MVDLRVPTSGKGTQIRYFIDLLLTFSIPRMLDASMWVVASSECTYSMIFIRLQARRSYSNRCRRSFELRGANCVPSRMTSRRSREAVITASYSRKCARKREEGVSFVAASRAQEQLLEQSTEAQESSDRRRRRSAGKKRQKPKNRVPWQPQNRRRRRCHKAPRPTDGRQCS